MVRRRDGPNKGWSAEEMVRIRDGLHAVRMVCSGDGPQLGWCAVGMVHRRNGPQLGWSAEGIFRSWDGPQKGWSTQGMVRGRNVTKILLLNNFLFSIFLNITALLVQIIYQPVSPFKYC